MNTIFVQLSLTSLCSFHCLFRKRQICSDLQSSGPFNPFFNLVASSALYFNMFSSFYKVIQQVYDLLLYNTQQTDNELLSHVETHLFQISSPSLAGIQTRDPNHDLEMYEGSRPLCYDPARPFHPYFCCFLFVFLPCFSCCVGLEAATLVTRKKISSESFVQ